MLNLRYSNGSEYNSVFFLPRISYIALGKKVPQEKNWENKGTNFCICLVGENSPNKLFILPKKF